MSEDLISVVVPIYKVEKYICKCVDSILAQTYTNLEIILVDDGSPDNCPQICDEYAEKDRRVKVIHQQNGGLSAARNAGIAAANGEYIGFVDSDDYIHPEMYQRLLDAQIAANSDISICSCEYVDEKGNIIPKDSPVVTEVLSNIDALRKLSGESWWYYVTVWNKLYKKNLFNNIRFPTGKIHEDNFVAHELLYKSGHVATIKEKLYYYVQRDNSIMSSQKSITNFDVVEALCNRSDFYHSVGLDELQADLMNLLSWQISDLCRNAVITGKNRKRANELCRRAWKIYSVRNDETSLKKKLFMWKPYEYIWIAKKKHLVCSQGQYTHVG